MRIQHNIMAMNAYRNYNNNNKALSGNLEKLSSGYKINRAGDDAAGLAISEKMRAQITGLEAAQKNVKDGISLVKTAEGAMQEIQDMLNRMDYLATQSANGTYQDEVDREAIQAEVDQLRTEINRIADSANFNGIKLLDGSLDSSTTRVDAAQAAVDTLSEPAQVDAVYKEKSASAIKGMMLTLGGDGPNGPTDVGTKTVLETEKVEVQNPSFAVSLNGTSHVLATDGTDLSGSGGADGTAKGVTLTVDGTAITVTEEELINYLADQGIEKTKGDTVTAEELAGAFANKIETTGAGGTPAAGVFIGTTADSSSKWNVSVKGDTLTFEFSDANVAPATPLNKHFTTTLAGDSTLSGTVNAAGNKFESDAYTAGTAGNGTNAKFTISVETEDGAMEFETEGLADKATSADVLAALKDAKNADGVKLSSLFKVTQANNKFTFEAIEKGADGPKVTDLAYTQATDGTGNNGSFATTATTSTDGYLSYQTGTNGYVNRATEIVAQGAPAESEQLASTSLDFSTTDITDGMKIRLGDEEYVFAVGADSKYKNAANVIDMTSATEKELKATGGDPDKRESAFSKLTLAAKDNKTFTVGHEVGQTNKISLKQRQEVKETTDMTTMDKFASYIGVSTVDTKATEALQAEADAARADELAAAQEKLAAAQGKVGKPLSLQIGDTSESFNQMTVSVGDMHVSAMGTGKYTDENGNEVQVTDTIADIDVGNQEGAQKAINVIKNAINYVSSVRGDLGAIQNRLDHTANNLSVMAENIQDAESTIRDTDVAEEMMSYVKNNILVQSAQAMLAQANQVPQGVLQLLG